MPAREVLCRVTSHSWVTSTVMLIAFEPSRKFHFDAGQFLSVVVPSPETRGRPLRRPYSFASSMETVKEEGYRLCVKLVEGGPGSTYLAGLKTGDVFRAYAPYGDFSYDPPQPGRSVCFISTGTGVAPFRAMALSSAFHENPGKNAMILFGARTEKEIIYPGFFESRGLQVINCVSQPRGDWTGFRGRVTDYLRGLPLEWPWQSTDFYICGNGEMIDEVRRILIDGRGVPSTSVHQEVYFTSRITSAEAVAA